MEDRSLFSHSCEQSEPVLEIRSQDYLPTSSRGRHGHHSATDVIPFQELAATQAPGPGSTRPAGRRSKAGQH